MKKKVLIHSLIFPPDGVSTAYLYGDIAKSLKEHGFEVEVLTTTPHYNLVEQQLEQQSLKWKIPGLLKESEFEGMRVLHVPQKKFKSTLLRLIGFVYWHIVSFFVALSIKNVDIILSPSPPLTIGLLNVWLGKLKGARVVYNVQEVYPDILGKKSGMAYKLLSRMERYIYNHSAGVITIDRVFYDQIVGRFKKPEKLHIIPNFVDTEIYRPVKNTDDLDPALFVANDHLKLLYAGNIGMAQDWDTLIEMAELTRNAPIDYYVIGEGMMRRYLADEISARTLSNVHLLPYQPRRLMPQIIAFSDIQFIFMEAKIAAQGFPSKVYTIMASGKPLLVCSPAKTPIVNFLQDIGCAHIITESSAKEKARKAVQWLESETRDHLESMGAKGFAEIKNRFSKEVVTVQYAELLNQL